MIFDELGLPKVNGASDLQDSAHLAGIMRTFFFPTVHEIDLKKYILPAGEPINLRDVDGMVRFPKTIYVRHPWQYKYDLSRDQVICLWAGMLVAGLQDEVSQDRVNGKDFFAPSVAGHRRICQGLAPRWWQTLWFKADLIWSAKMQPLEELCQIFCMLAVHPDRSLVKWYCEMNPQWRWAIKRYFCELDGAWRDEPELAEVMIQRIESWL